MDVGKIGALNYNWRRRRVKPTLQQNIRISNIKSISLVDLVRIYEASIRLS